MSDVDHVLARLEQLEAAQAIQRLAHDYCIGADSRDHDRWEAVWTSDAVWATGAEEENIFRGLPEICAAVQRQWRTFPRMQHATANHAVDIDGDQASGRCDVVVMVQLPDMRWLIGGGTYEDEYRRDSGVWHIARRTVQRPFDLEPLAGTQGPIRIDEPVASDLPEQHGGAPT